MTTAQALNGDNAAPTTATAASSETRGQATPEEQENLANEKRHTTVPKLTGGQPLQQKISSGTWGETQTGEAVDPISAARALQEYRLAREATRSSRASHPRQSRQPSVSRRGKEDLEQGQQHQPGEENNAVDNDGDSEDEFDLANWMLSRKAAAEEKGLQYHKPLGLSWRNLKIISPGGADAKIFVKTLPQAILNTATKDPLNILAKIITPLGRLLAPKQTPVPLIRGHDGVLKAGEMLLVLGRPGSGCSTTLRALTSSSHNNLQTEGTLTYGGFTPDQLTRKYRGESVFVDEDDIHFPTLTVEQTLKFALQCKVPSGRSRIHGQTRAQFIDDVVDVLLKMFAMTHVRKTVVGDAAVRGVSGGERKRVTLQEALITRGSIIAWDNSTRGLDASTALDYARSLRIVTDIGRRTTVATLYQVSESIYDLFDRVSVIDEGRCIYYGPRDKARQYFHELGYFSPARQTTADFVTAVTDPNQVQYRDDFEGTIPRSSEEREKAWKNSALYKDLISEVETYEDAVSKNELQEAENVKALVRSEKNKGVNKGSSFTVNYWTQVKACIYRDLLIKWGARGDIYIKVFTIVSVSLMIASLFYGQSQDSSGVFTRGGIILFACLLNGWLQLSETYEAVAGRPMLARHQTFAFYHPSAVCVSRALVDIPFIAFQCILSSVIIYFLSSLRINAGAFFIFLVYTFLCAYNLTALYRAIAVFSPGFNEAIRFSVLALNIIIVFVGYVIRRPQMNWMIWLNYVNGISYAFEGMLTNELKYPIQCAPSSIVPFGEARDTAFQTCALTGSTPGSIVVQSQDYLSVTFNYSQAAVGPNIGVLIAFSALYLIITIVASELIPLGGGSGGITIFAKTKAARQQMKAAEPASPDDAEASAVSTRRSPASDDSSNATPVGSHTPNESREKSRKAGMSGGEEVDHKITREHPDRAIFTWSDVNLELPSGRKLLQHVDGWVRPGQMTALMGASGAGKTTLMTALSQRGAAGGISGDILVDGKPLGPGFQKSTGLVLQGDVHLATQTVREAVEFSALLRQPHDIPEEEKLKDAQRVLELLELQDLADAIIGHPGAGLGIERRKRVTIAVELAAKPDLLLFLDEPTSGLDSAGAASICRLLRRLAQDGQAILCTIHQPSALLFESFDNVLLLSPGGRTAYFGQIGEHHGTGSDRIRAYFEGKGAYPCDPHANVAEYILEVVSGGKSQGKDWGNVWLESPECRETREKIQEIVAERSELPASDDPRAQREFAATPMVQLKQVTMRQFKDMWRDPSFPYAILFSNFVTGIIAGGAFANLGLSPTDYQNRVFIAFLIILNFPALVNGIIAKFFELRILFEVRENASKIYPWWAMMASFIITTMPIALVASIIYFLPSYYIPFYSEPSSKAGYFFLMVFLFNIFGIEFSLMLAASSPTPITAANLLPFLLPILAIVNGVIVPQSSMTNPWRDFVYWANPVTHYMRGQISTLLHATPVICNEADLFRFDPPPGQTCEVYAGEWVTQAGGYLDNAQGTSGCGFCQYTVGDQFAATVNSPYAFRWQSMGIFLGYVIFNVGASFVLYWLFRVRGFSLSVGPVKKLFKKK